MKKAIFGVAGCLLHAVGESRRPIGNRPQISNLRHNAEVSNSNNFRLKATFGCLFFTLAVCAAQSVADGPRYTADGQLLFPKDYREWVFLSSGLGMTYGPAGAAASEAPRFDNVFVNRSAYKSFLASGRWPDKTIFILEIRKSQLEGSINRGGHFQTSTAAVEAHVKDEKRFAGSWAFFGFAEGKQRSEERRVGKE